MIMDFAAQINFYYNAESRHACRNGMATGIVMIMLAVLLWLFSDSESVSKGIAVVLLFG